MPNEIAVLREVLRSPVVSWLLSELEIPRLQPWGTVKLW
jgi:hypothetical protein